MKRTYYQKATKRNVKRNLRFLGVFIAFVGFVIVVYIFTPLVSWQLFYEPIFAEQKIVAPIPPNIIANAENTRGSVLGDTTAVTNVDFTNAENWFPHYAPVKKDKSKLKAAYYTLTIPKLKITNALVSAIDDDLTLHLVNFGGTAVPPERGTAVVFGHSTLTWLFDQHNYKTIFANAQDLAVGDKLITTVNGVQYIYKVYSVTVVDPDDLSIFDQKTDDSYLTLVTCTPPGTVLYRLIIRSRLERI